MGKQRTQTNHCHPEPYIGLSASRSGQIEKVTVKGHDLSRAARVRVNMGALAPCGNAAPWAPTAARTGVVRPRRVEFRPRHITHPTLNYEPGAGGAQVLVPVKFIRYAGSPLQIAICGI